MAKVKGHILDPTTVLSIDGVSMDFSNVERGSVGLLEPTTLKNNEWAILYGKYEFDAADGIYNAFYQCSKRYHVTVEEPKWLELGPGKLPVAKYLEALKSVSPTLSIVVVVLSDPSLKPQIKRLLDQKGIPSQFVLAHTAKKATSAMAVASNILKQINAK